MSADRLQIRREGSAILLAVKVVPGASRTRILGVLGGALRVAIAAPPHRGQANRALLRFLAEVLGVSASRVSIIQGHGSARKTIRFQDLSESHLFSKLHQA
jgi:hypothetical protein